MQRESIAVLLVLVLAVLGGPLRAQEEDAVGKTAAESAGAPKPSASLAGGTIIPLTIDQIRRNLPSGAADQFEFLRRQRKITREAIEEASAKLRALASSITVLQSRKDSLEAQEKEHVQPSYFYSKERVQDDLQGAKADLAAAKKNLETAKLKPRVSQDEIERLEWTVRDKQDFVYRVQAALDNFDQARNDEEKRKQEWQNLKKATIEDITLINNQRDKVEQSQISYQRLLEEIDDMANQLFISSDATNSFKLNMSIAFALLVSIVIICFFGIAYSNEAVKTAIFSNDAGIQFITIFSIVIAVILFGIIGVLESRELSALLGGLSGYILGRGREKPT